MSATECVTTMKFKIKTGLFRIGIDSAIIPSKATTNAKSSSVESKKRGLSEAIDGRKEKRRKMDCSVTQQCSLEAKWSDGHPVVQQRQNTNGIVKRLNNSCKKLTSAVEKPNLEKQLSEILRGKVPSHLQGFLKKSDFGLQRVKMIEKVVDALSDEDLLELKKIVQRSWMVRTTKVSPAKEPDHVCHHARVKTTQKGINNNIRSGSGYADVIPSTNSVTSVCGLHRTMKCECNKKSSIVHASRDISSDGSRDHVYVSMRDCGTKLHSDPQFSKPKIESKGVESALNEDLTISCHPVSTTDTAAEGLNPSGDSELSAQKALRATLLKSRFADTILRAKQKVDKADPVKSQQKKKRQERQQQEDRAGKVAGRKLKVSCNVRAEAERDLQREREAKRKLQREQERKAARLALEQMVKTVEINNDHRILKDLELLSGCSQSDQYSYSSCESSTEVGSGKRGHFSKALEQLGLFMKDDYNDYMEDEDEDRAVLTELEDGEII